MEFISIDVFMSLAGCVLVVAFITQALKTYFNKINALILNFIVSFIIGVIRIFVLKDYSFEGILTGVLNIFVLMLAAGGSYDTAKLTYNTFKNNEISEDEDYDIEIEEE